MYKPYFFAIIKYISFIVVLGVTKNIQNYYMAGFNEPEYETELDPVITKISQERGEFDSLIHDLNILIEDIKNEEEPLELNDVYNKVSELKRDVMPKIERFETIKKLSEHIANLCDLKIKLSDNDQSVSKKDVYDKTIALESLIEQNESKRRLKPFGTLMRVGQSVIMTRMSHPELRAIKQKCDDIKQNSINTLKTLEQSLSETLRELMRVSNEKNLSFGLEGICKTYLRKNKDNLDLSQVPQECLDVINAPFIEKGGGRRKSRKNRKSRKSRKSRKN